MREKQERNGLGGKILLGAAVGSLLLGWQVLNRIRETDLRGQVALITGGSSGLGFLLAREFASEGCRIVICARDPDELRWAGDELRRNGAKALTVECDVADRQQVERMVQQATDHFGRVDILVNNAGVIQAGPLESMELEDFEMAMDIMYWGTVYTTLAVLPQMRARRSGRVVNITSIGGKVSVPHLLPYGAAKFAAVGFSQGLRAEVGDDNITVTTIVPGLMRTGSFRNALFKGDQEKEFVWFSLGSALPLISMDAERAARQIVQATKRGDAERILSLPANVLAKLHGVFPGATANILREIDRMMLPEPDGEDRKIIPGREVQRELDSPTLETVTQLGQSAAQRFQPEDVDDATDRPG
jgi:NAD(P)-dependent dehydrogenase (short-subunit alcohol dehydrogenase family)